MGGFNSGRYGGPPSLERTSSLRLDVNRVVRACRVSGFGATVWQWQRDGEAVQIVVSATLNDPWPGTGTVRIRHGSICHVTGSETGAQDYEVRLDSTPCQLGGIRWWFRCPRTARRCGKLYLPNGGYRFWSRQAYGLVYQVQREVPLDRAHRSIGRTYAKVGAEYRTPGADWPKRPKGMHHRTYERLTQEMFAGEDLLDTAFVAGADRILRQLDRLRRQ